MKTMRHAAIIALAMGAALCVRAADRTGPEPTEVIHPRSSAPVAAASESKIAAPEGASLSLAGTVGYVLAIAVLVGGAWFLLKRGTLPRALGKNAGKLQVLETRMLGNRQFLVVVEYDDAKMLLGVCQGRIDYLTPLAGHPLAAAGLGDDNDAQVSFDAAGGVRR